MPASSAGHGRRAQRVCPIEAGRGAKNTEKRARRPPGRPNTPKTPTLQELRQLKKITTPKSNRPAPTGPAEQPSLQRKSVSEALDTRPLVPTWHAPMQRGARETASDRAVARNFGATARGDASRASAERARAADTPRAPSTRGGTPGAGGGRRGSLVNPYGGECGRGGGDTAEPSSCRDGHISPPPEKKGKSSAKK